MTVYYFKIKITLNILEIYLNLRSSDTLNGHFYNYPYFNWLFWFSAWFLCKLKVAIGKICLTQWETVWDIVIDVYTKRYVRLLLWTWPDSSQGKRSLLGPFWPPLLPHTSARVHAPCHGLCFYTFIICLDTQKPTSTATEGLNGCSGGHLPLLLPPCLKGPLLDASRWQNMMRRTQFWVIEMYLWRWFSGFYCLFKYCISLPLWPQPNYNTDKENTPVFCSFWASQKLNQVIFWIIY